MLFLTCVIEESSPLIIRGSFRKADLGNEFGSLVIEIVMQVVPQEEVQEGGLTLKIRLQGACTEAGMKGALKNNNGF